MGRGDSQVRKSRFTDEQKLNILREADEKGIRPTARQYGIGVPTLYRWQEALREGGDKAKRKVAALERENRALRNALVDRNLELQVLKEISSKKW